MKVNIINFQKKIPIGSSVSTKIKKTVVKTLSLEGSKGLSQVNICLVSDNQIKKLNWMFLKHKGPTDVISFNLGTAEIAISTDTVISNSKFYKTNPHDELLLYVAHGVLHTLGYDDNTLKKRAIMQAKQEKICQSIKPKP